jgi:hypothetical protein
MAVSSTVRAWNGRYSRTLVRAAKPVGEGGARRAAWQRRFGISTRKAAPWAKAHGATSIDEHR